MLEREVGQNEWVGKTQKNKMYTEGGVNDGSKGEGGSRRKRERGETYRCVSAYCQNSTTGRVVFCFMVMLRLIFG